jgi:hypothetical protein
VAGGTRAKFSAGRNALNFSAEIFIDKVSSLMNQQNRDKITGR